MRRSARQNMVPYYEHDNLAQPAVAQSSNWNHLAGTGIGGGSLADHPFEFRQEPKHDQPWTVYSSTTGVEQLLPPHQQQQLQLEIPQEQGHHVTQSSSTTVPVHEIRTNRTSLPADDMGTLFSDIPPSSFYDPVENEQFLPELGSNDIYATDLQDLPASFEHDEIEAQGIMMDQLPPTTVSTPLQQSKTNRRGKNKNLACNQCTKTFGCPSDLKKHIDKHNKPFMCDVPGCKRKTGFQDQTNLNRHKATHGILGNGKSYKCAGTGCRKPDVVWHRLDNFRKHIESMHKFEDTKDVIERSTNVDAQTDAAAYNEQSVSNDSLGKIKPDIAASQSTAIDTSMASSQILTPTMSQDLTLVDSGEYATPNALAAGHENSALDVLSAVAVMSTISSDPVPPSTHPTTTLTLALNAFVSSMKQLQEAMANLNSLNTNNSTVPSAAHMNAGESSAVHQSAQAGSMTDAAKTIILKQLEVMVKSVKDDQSSAPVAPAVDFNDEKQSSATPGARVKCAQCTATFKRHCDLNKHLKRHKKPYGCTFPECRKVFGSKNDWKRHENSQHFQSDFWKCQESQRGEKFDTCKYSTYKDGKMQDHLTEHHKLYGQALLDRLQVTHAGRNRSKAFWCGFCGEMIKLYAENNKAWDERFDHIDNHFMKDNRHIDDWWDADKWQTRGELIAAAIAAKENCSGDEQTNKSGGKPRRQTESMNVARRSAFDAVSPGDIRGSAAKFASKTGVAKKRKAAKDADSLVSNAASLRSSGSSKKPRKAIPIANPAASGIGLVMTCCKCNAGGSLRETSDRCLVCQEPWCAQCGQEECAPPEDMLLSAP